MSMYKDNVLEHHDGVETVHLPHNYELTAGYHTLCGLCDVGLTIEDTGLPVTCYTCLGVLRHVLALAAERGVIRHNPSAKSRERAKYAVE